MPRSISRFHRRSRVIRSPTPDSSRLNALSLPQAIISENALPGALIGTLAGTTPGSSLALAADAGGRFALSGSNVVAGLVATDFETATSHSITVRETLAGASNSPRDTVLTINVSDVAEIPLIPVGARLIHVGDSIASYVNTTSFRAWFNTHSRGHFYTPPGTNQGIGGATLTTQASATNAIGGRSDWWINQLTELQPCALAFAIGTNDMSNAAATLAIMQSTLQGHITAARARAPSCWILLCKVLRSSSNQTFNANPEINLTKFDAFNAWLDTLHNPAGRVIVLGSRVAAVGITTTDLQPDLLHPNANGAFKIGQADANDVAPFLASGSILFGATAPGDNLEPDWRLEGTAGTLGLGITSGQVATGWSAFCNTLGTAGGVSIGVTAVASKITIDIPGVGVGLPAQQIDVTGTASAAGVLTLINSVPTGLTFDEFAEGFGHVRVSATDGVSAPVGGTSQACLLGVSGQQWNKTVDPNAGPLPAAYQGVWRTVPVANLQNNNTSNLEFSVALAAGPVDLRFIVAQTGVRLVETVAYAAPFNIGAPMTGPTNPLGPRPRLNGTAGVGNVLTLQPGIWSGGGCTRQSVVKRGATVILTRNPGDTPMTYTQVVADQGNTLTLEDTATNALGGPVTAVSAGVVAP
jgi:lysophospholipase L1-like esterase